MARTLDTSSTRSARRSSRAGARRSDAPPKAPAKARAQDTHDRDHDDHDDEAVHAELQAMRKDHDRLHAQLMQSKVELRHARGELARLREQALKDYGTADLGELEAMLVARREENAAKLTAYRQHLDDLTTALDTIDEDTADDTDLEAALAFLDEADQDGDDADAEGGGDDNGGDENADDNEAELDDNDDDVESADDVGDEAAPPDGPDLAGMFDDE